MRRWKRTVAAAAGVMGVLAGTMACSGSNSAGSPGTSTGGTPVGSSAAPPPGGTSPGDTSPAGAPAVVTPDAVLLLSTAQRETLQRVLDETVPRLGAARGAMAAVWLPGTGSWSGVAGTADPATGRPPETGMHVRAGSNTKTFTVMLILQLVDAGKLSLDDPIRRWFPELPDGDRITVRNLANMTSGIANYSEDVAFDQMLCDNPQRVYQPDELVQMGTSKPRTFAAGQGYEYSNTNTAMLGLIVEQVTSRPYVDVLRDQILGPLGLSQTSFPAPTDASIPAPFPHGFTTNGTCRDVDATGWNPSWTSYAGQLISTLRDLQVWAYQLGSGRLLRRETYVAQSTFVPNPAAPGLGYGLGLADFAGWWGHNGSIPGYNSYAVYDPDTEAVIVLVAFSDIPVDGQSPATVLLRALIAVLPDLAGEAAEGDPPAAPSSVPLED